jgi:hypothetical protein
MVSAPKPLFDSISKRFFTLQTVKIPRNATIVQAADRKTATNHARTTTKDPLSPGNGVGMFTTTTQQKQSGDTARGRTHTHTKHAQEAGCVILSFGCVGDVRNQTCPPNGHHQTKLTHRVCFGQEQPSSYRRRWTRKAPRQRMCHETT